jgi:hypothetical protein
VQPGGVFEEGVDDGTAQAEACGDYGGSGYNSDGGGSNSGTEVLDPSSVGSVPLGVSEAAAQATAPSPTPAAAATVSPAAAAPTPTTPAAATTTTTAAEGIKRVNPRGRQAGVVQWNFQETVASVLAFVAANEASQQSTKESRMLAMANGFGFQMGLVCGKGGLGCEPGTSKWVAAKEGRTYEEAVSLRTSNPAGILARAKLMVTTGESPTPHSEIMGAPTFFSCSVGLP